MTADVFISHSSKDAKLAETLCAALENRGIRCWMAPRNIDPGDNYAASIVRAIRAGTIGACAAASAPDKPRWRHVGYRRREGRRDPWPPARASE